MLLEDFLDEGLLEENYKELKSEVCRQQVLNCIKSFKTVAGQDVILIKRLTKVASHIMYSDPNALAGLEEKLYRFNIEGAEMIDLDMIDDRSNDSILDEIDRDDIYSYTRMKSHFYSHAGSTLLMEFEKRPDELALCEKGYECKKQSGLLSSECDQEHAMNAYIIAASAANKRYYCSTTSEDKIKWAGRGIACSELAADLAVKLEVKCHDAETKLMYKSKRADQLFSAGVAAEDIHKELEKQRTETTPKTENVNWLEQGFRYKRRSATAKSKYDEANAAFIHRSAAINAQKIVEIYRDNPAKLVEWLKLELNEHLSSGGLYEKSDVMNAVSQFRSAADISMELYEELCKTGSEDLKLVEDAYSHKSKCVQLSKKIMPEYHAKAQGYLGDIARLLSEKTKDISLSRSWKEKEYHHKHEWARGLEKLNHAEGAMRAYCFLEDLALSIFNETGDDVWLKRRYNDRIHAALIAKNMNNSYQASRFYFESGRFANELIELNENLDKNGKIFWLTRAYKGYTMSTNLKNETNVFTAIAHATTGKIAKTLYELTQKDMWLDRWYHEQIQSAKESKPKHAAYSYMHASDAAYEKFRKKKNLQSGKDAYDAQINALSIAKELDYDTRIEIFPQIIRNLKSIITDMYHETNNPEWEERCYKHLIDIADANMDNGIGEDVYKELRGITMLACMGNKDAKLAERAYETNVKYIEMTEGEAVSEYEVLANFSRKKFKETKEPVWLERADSCYERILSHYEANPDSNKTRYLRHISTVKRNLYK